MKRILNTLYVTNEDAWLLRDGETILVRVDRETKLQIPIHTIASIVCFGRVSCTTPMMTLCAERGVGLVFMSAHGRFQARIAGPVTGNVLLRRAQYRAADDEETALRLARGMVSAKIANCRTALMRALRDQGESDALGQAVARLRQRLKEVRDAATLDAVRGIEGEAARTYFSAFDAMMTNADPVFQFERRSRRPPLNPINAILSFLYAILAGDATGAVECVGLDPAVGFLHAQRPGRPSLALDLVEEFRPVLADRVALSLVNRRQLTARDFDTGASGAVMLRDDGRRTVLAAWQKRKQEVVRHPFLEERMEFGIAVLQQARLMAQAIRGDQDDYPAFIWR